jgi:peptide/nickel transport system permease protein
MLALTSILIFVTLRVIPGNPVITRYGATRGVDPAALQELERQLGLDKPIPVQYVDWIAGVFRGDFGVSYFSQFSVTTLIGQRLGPTLELAAVALVIALIIAVPAGIIAGMRPNSIIDRAISGFVTMGMALPPFVLGIVLVAIFAVRLNWLPAQGFVDFSENPSKNLTLVVLPSLTLAIVAAAPILRFLRASILETLQSPYIRTAEGKGLLWRQVVLRHALPNALVPTVTVIGLIVGNMLGGVVVIEYVFGWQGLGALAVDSVLKRDYAVLQSVVLLVAAIFIITNLVVDLLYGVIDPRLRVGGQGA